MQKNSLSLKNCRYILAFTNGLNESLVTFFMGFNNKYILYIIYYIIIYIIDFYQKLLILKGSPSLQLINNASTNQKFIK